MSTKPASAARVALAAASRAAGAQQAVKAAAGELRQALAEQRSRIAELKAEIDEVKTSPFDSVESDRRIDEAVKHLAASAAERHLSLAGLLTDGPARLTYDEGTLMALRLLALTNPTGLAAGLRRLCSEHVEIHGPGLSPAEKASRLNAAKTELDQMEKEEELLIRNAAAAGVRLDRRTDVSAASFLGLDLTGLEG